MIMSRSASHVYEPPAGERPAEISSPEPPLVFDREGIRAVDRAAIQEYGIPGIVLMENAALGLATEALRMMDAAGDRSPAVLIVCGSGNNGGDGYALARHLHNRGVQPILVSIGEPQPHTDAGVNFAVCRNMRLRQVSPEQVKEVLQREHISLIVDAIFGTGLDRPVPQQVAEVIETINASGRPVLAVDVPSGIDCNSGSVLGAAIQATRTVTFVGHKAGFTELHAQKLLGEIVVVDIGAPRELTRRFGRSLDLPHPEVPEHDPPSGMSGRSVNR